MQLTKLSGCVADIVAEMTVWEGVVVTPSDRAYEEKPPEEEEEEKEKDEVPVGEEKMDTVCLIYDQIWLASM